MLPDFEIYNTHTGVFLKKCGKLYRIIAKSDWDSSREIVKYYFEEIELPKEEK